MYINKRSDILVNLSSSSFRFDCQDPCGLCFLFSLSCRAPVFVSTLSVFLIWGGSFQRNSMLSTRYARSLTKSSHPLLSIEAMIPEGLHRSKQEPKSGNLCDFLPGFGVLGLVDHFETLPGSCSLYRRLNLSYQRPHSYRYRGRS